MLFIRRIGHRPLGAIAVIAAALFPLQASNARPFPIFSTIPSSSSPAIPSSSPAAMDTAYFTNDTTAHMVALKYTGVLAAVFFIIDGHITPTSQLPPAIILGWDYDGPYTNVLASPLPPGSGRFPSFGTGPLFTYTGRGKIAWAEAADTLARLVPVEYPGGAYHGCGYQWSGNVDCDPQQSVDISDLTRLIDFLFISRSPLCCEGEANCDGSSGIDIGDLSRLIDFLFINGTPPAPCR
ncbi:MAG: hypothetical protein HY851_09825 [candidate division Zixibacteria bacterium]|nr:hypothetical protein [candidate division Zixibacteria bacterium]